ncbi:MAG: 3-oxoacyl-ACP synthase [Ketobacter sp.]|nr:MAG: 3-oxoacyl-ACP synthase [Ketobacter sp.]
MGRQSTPGTRVFQEFKRMIASRFESIGVYLPEKEVTTQSLVSSMETQPMFDLEKLTGVKSRRWRSDSEDCHTLAMSAIERCLHQSHYRADDIDVIVCTSITRFTGGLRFALEPGLSATLKNTLGMRRNALNFDITNACAGMFTGVYLMDQMIKSGAEKTGLVVSGECITPITETALKEINNPIDEQFASLTVGDSGAAVIMDRSVNEHSRLNFLELFTLAEFSEFCFGMPSNKNPGVAMYTKAMEIHATVIQRLPSFLGQFAERYQVSGIDFQHVIPHQTSERAIRTALELCSETFGDIPHICVSLDKFGNTSSTSHFVVLDDQMRQGIIKPGDNVLMLILASGIILGAASVTVGNLGGIN